MQQYNGTIQFHRVLKANLPLKTAGKKIFFVVNNPTDTVGEIWATNNEGNVICYSVAVDVSELSNSISEVKEQIDDLNLKDQELEQQINDLFIDCGTFRTFQNGYTGSTRAYKIGRLVFVSIYATNTSFSEWEIICTLPVEIRPSNNRITTPVGGGPGTYNNGICFYVKTNGDLALTTLPAVTTEISGIAIFEL